MGLYNTSNQGAAPSTPASGYSVVYFLSSDKNLYWKDDAGNARAVVYNGITSFSAATLTATTQLVSTSGTFTLGTAFQLKNARTTGVGAAATTIATLTSSSYTGMMFVIGESGSAGFIDQVTAIATTLTVISSTTIYGAPGARTYSQSGTAMQVSIASGSWTINTMLLVGS